MMVESEAKELSEDIMLGAVNFGHQKMQLIINAIEELVTDSDVNILDWTPPELDDKGYEEFYNKYKDQITDAYTITKKQERNEKLSLIKSEILESESGDEEDTEEKITDLFEKAQKISSDKELLMEKE